MTAATFAPAQPVAIDVPDISVVIPCYNEEENAGPIAAAVIAELERADVSFELIFIDNASQDRTVAVIRALCANDPRIRLIANTRNFGQMRSPTHGIYQAGGRAVIGMCADFQDPPELLGPFIARWREGVDIVLGVRDAEKVSGFFSWARELGYSLLVNLGEYPIVRNATGFGLYDRKVVDTIMAMNEPEPFFRGMLVETGFSLETILYHRPQRRRGISSNNFLTLIDFALSGLASAPKKLLRLPFIIALLCGAASALCLLMVPVAFWFDLAPLGWLAAAGVELQFALLFLFLAILGDQVRMISSRTRRTPLVIERERVNFPERP